MSKQQESINVISNKKSTATNPSSQTQFFHWVLFTYLTIEVKHFINIVLVVYK